MDQKQFFASTWHKVSRAREHLEALQCEVLAMHEDEPYSILQEEDSETGIRRAVFQDDSAERREHLALIFGDLVHNLRSALDHAITDMTILHGGGPLPKTEFPVFTEEDRFHQRHRKTNEPTPVSGLYKIRGIDPRLVVIIEEFQPYKPSPPNTINPLQVIHDLDIADKHRAIHVVNYRPTKIRYRVERYLEIVSVTVGANMKLEHGLVLARWKPIGPDTVEADMKFESLVATYAIDESPSPGMHPIDTFGDEMIRSIENRLKLLEKFSREAKARPGESFTLHVGSHGAPSPSSEIGS